MKAMILAAGLGTRLKPFTDKLPKAMVPVAGKPMILHLLEKLAGYGIREFVVNLHHYADKLQDYLTTLDLPGVTIHFSDERDALLDTGGALKRAAGFFSDGKPFLVHNVDVWTSLDLTAMLDHHLQSGASATLAVRKRKSSRFLLFDQADTLCGWENLTTGDRIILRDPPEELTSLAFSGVQIIHPDIFCFFPVVQRFSLIELYLEAGRATIIKGFRHDADEWIDLGTPEMLGLTEG